MKKSAFKKKIFYGGQSNPARKSVKKPNKSSSWFGLFDEHKAKKQLSKSKLPKVAKKTERKETSFKYQLSDKKQKSIFFQSIEKEKKEEVELAETKPKDPNVKVFGPSADKLRKENKRLGLPEKANKTGRRRYGQKTLQQIQQLRQSAGGLDRLWLNWKSWSLRMDLARRFNRLVAILLIAGSFLFVTYLTFFDTYFLVKDYEVYFAKNSYIDSQKMEEVMQSLREDRFLVFVPNNQFWFLNDQNLTSAAKGGYSDIVSVELIERKWPDKATLQVTTEPILLTLGINDGKEYWRIGQSGEVLSKDEANLRENLVVVEKPVTLTYSSAAQVNNQLPTFDHYSFEHRTIQKNRFWYIIWLWEQLNELKIDYIKTSIPSLSEFDTDVVITTRNNTGLLFDLTAGDRENQRKKLDLALRDSTIGVREGKGQLEYIDFRTSKRVFVCPRGGKCAGS